MKCVFLSRFPRHFDTHNIVMSYKTKWPLNDSRAKINRTGGQKLLGGWNVSFRGQHLSYRVMITKFAVQLTRCGLDVIRRHGSGSALAQIMTCCLTATSHQLNQFLLIISGVLWHSSEDNFTASIRITTLYNRSKNNTFRITATPPRDQWVKEQYTYNFNGIPNWPTRVLSLVFYYFRWPNLLTLKSRSC